MPNTFPPSEMNTLKDLEDSIEDVSRHNITIQTVNNSITALSARYCGLTRLPESLGRLTNLQHLDLTGNYLTALPTSLENLLHLKTLHLDDNQLSILPSWLSNLPHLEAIHADENRLTSFPEYLCRRQTTCGKKRRDGPGQYRLFHVWGRYG